MAQGILEGFQGEAAASRQRKARRQPGRRRFPGAFLSERHPGAPFLLLSPLDSEWRGEGRRANWARLIM